MKNRKMCITPKKCTGCTTCGLTCSITYNDNFDLSKSHIRIEKNDMLGIFNIIFSSTCLSCYKCAQACPTGCLEIIHI